MSSRMVTASSQAPQALIIGLYVRTSGLMPATFRRRRKSRRSCLS
eukprot:CAMPEP_0114643176 /NCGR_PEP_ID=MMETSP0191-20121206/3234_1 /TAXON_ID=126664 /ORGANISM="Sorites sp." /LENGTH=44 /DNA_ID= /DNA_START= /DNA_END= /DNA_ORIENTATION=